MPKKNLGSLGKKKAKKQINEDDEFMEDEIDVCMSFFVSFRILIALEYHFV
jgi:hypothetical protein